MTKKSKQDSMSALNRHNSQKIERDQQSIVSSLNLKKSSQLKKSIKKPEQQLGLTEKVELMKEKSHKFCKYAEKKIDRMIEIMDEIDEKHLLPWVNQHKNGASIKQENLKQEQVKHQTIQLEQSQQPNQPLSAAEKDLIQKTLSNFHNLLTYERPLSHIKHEFQSFYSRLSQFAKQLSSQSTLPTDKKFLIPENGLTFEEIRHIQQLIKEHYLRKGCFQVADVFDRYGKEVQQQKNGREKICSEKNILIEEQKQQQQKASNNHFQKFQNITKLSTKKIINSKKQKKKPKVQLIDLQQNFKQCFILRQQLLQKNFTETIAWCVQQRLYETHSNPLEYNLRLAEIKLLIEQKKYRVVFDKIEKEMVRFLDNYEEINGLIGFLLFSCGWDAGKMFGEETEKETSINETIPSEQQQLETFQNIITSRYQKFHASTVHLPTLAHSFTQQYFIHYDISQFDTLQICYEVGKMYEQQYFDSIKLFSEKDREEFLKHRGHCDLDDKYSGTPHTVVLPFEIPVDKQYLYHSIFVCPVTKEVLSSNDGVEWLSCGHLVSESAKKNMAEVRRSNHKQKCPVCQKDRASEVVKVRF